MLGMRCGYSLKFVGGVDSLLAKCFSKRTVIYQTMYPSLIYQLGMGITCALRSGVGCVHPMNREFFLWVHLV